MRQRTGALLRAKPRSIKGLAKLCGIERKGERRSATPWVGKSRFTFNARNNRDEPTNNGNGNVLCLAAACTKETSKCRYNRLRFAGVEVCATCHPVSYTHLTLPTKRIV